MENSFEKKEYRMEIIEKKLLKNGNYERL